MNDFITIATFTLPSEMVIARSKLESEFKYGLAINKYEPKGLELIPYMCFFIIFPIGIWKFQPGIAKLVQSYRK